MLHIYVGNAAIILAMAWVLYNTVAAVQEVYDMIKK